MKTINDYISYIPAIENPLSSDVVICRINDEFWIFDVGNDEINIEIINNLPGKKNVVISHFHPDHLGNINMINYDQLFVGKNTHGYTHTGIIVENKLIVGDFVEIIPLPSTHAKGSLALKIGEYLFVGDGLYGKRKDDKYVLNKGFLIEQIKLIEKMENLKYICSSHEFDFVKTKETVLTDLKNKLAKAEKNNPYIEM